MKCFYLIIGLLAFIQDGKCRATSEDSSEYGNKNVPGAKSTTCDCGWRNKKVGGNAGGVETDINEYPMMAGLYNKPKQQLFCGGTIITVYHVLTAAHCTEEIAKANLADVQVVVGEHDLKKGNESPATHYLDILNYKQHPKYNKRREIFDISVINLKEKIPFSMYVGPACMPTTQEEEMRRDVKLVREKVKVLGWGKLEENGEQSNVLIGVNQEVIPSSSCVRKYHWIELSKGSFFCTVGLNKDFCKNDYGNPLLYHDKETNRYVLAGATSFRMGCASDKTPGVNAYVSYYLPWINEVIAETRPDAVMCHKKEIIKEEVISEKKPDAIKCYKKQKVNSGSDAMMCYKKDQVNSETKPEPFFCY